MKRLIKIAPVILLTIQAVQAQTNVYECGTYIDATTQAELDAVDTYLGGCVFMEDPNGINYFGSTVKEVQAATQIHIAPEFHAGGFDTTGNVHLKIQDSAQFDVVSMNYTDLSAILRYKKFELGVQLPDDILTKVNHFLLANGEYTDELNPFVEWDLDVEAVFYNASPGWYEVVDGFYYREYQPNAITKDWDDIGTEYPIRIRYAPPQNGNWTCQMRIKVDSVVLYTSPTFGFQVVESGDPGYVKVHPNKKNLMRGDQIIYPVGQNFVGPEMDALPWGTNPLFSSQTTFKASDAQQWQQFRNHVENYFEAGGKFIRLIQSPWSMLLEFEKKGNYYDRLHYAWEQDKLIEKCEEYDVQVLYNLMMQEPFMEYGDYDFSIWDWNKWWRDTNKVFHYDPNSQNPVYCYNDNPQETGGKQPHEMFLNESDLTYHEQRMRYYVSRYGYSTSIYEFELLSEPYHLNQKWSDLPGAPLEPYLDTNNVLQDTIFHAIENYHGRMTWYIKEKMGHWQQLIGVNSVYPAWKPSGDVHIDQSFLHGNIDIVGINWYAKLPNKYILSGHEDVDENNTFIGGENSFAKTVYDFQSWSGKPVILAEGDHGDGTYGCSGSVGNKIDAMCMGFNGLCGFNFWVGAGEPQTDVWSATISAQNFMNGAHVIGTFSEGYGDWIIGRQREKANGNLEVFDCHPSKELQYYVSQNQEYAIGYVRNLTYNLHTKRTNENCAFQWSSQMGYEYDELNVCINSEIQYDPYDNLRDIDWQMGDNLFVTGLKNNHDYTVEWYSFVDGWSLGSDCQNTSSDRFKLKHPELITTFFDRPIVWFFIRVQNCQSGMVAGNDQPDQTEGAFQNFQFDDNNLSVMNSSREGTTVNAHPNPFGGKIVIETPVEDELLIQSAEGMEILRTNVQKGANEIITTELAKGVYLLHLRSQNVTIKVIKQ